MSVTAAWWDGLEGGKVVCRLCPNACTLDDGQDGPCRTRGNRDGRMVPLRYGEVAAGGMDPIEKKPLYHFHPGAGILSVAAVGCNLHCAFCQNWQLSQDGGRAPGGDRRRVEPLQLVDRARELGSIGLAYTYSEPLVWYEFVRDTAGAIREAGLKNVIVSNGYLKPEPLAELLPLIDAANIDLKSLDDDFYRRVCKGSLAPVLRSLEMIKASGAHLEVTNLVIPGWNDDDARIAALADFVAGLGRETPLHLSAYRPAWKFDAPPTPPETLRRAAAIARERLDHVFPGNVHLPGESDTRCPGCGAVLIERGGYAVRNLLDAGGHCPGCGRGFDGILGRID